MKLLKIILVFLLIPLSFFSQESSPIDYSFVDTKTLEIPETMSNSTTLIAKYINSNFTTDREKTRAAFIWTASNISYDLKYLYSSSENREEKIVRSLKTRKGICENYAALFTEICNKVGIKSYVIEGYTKQHSLVDAQSHAWSASLIDGSWYLFDPTWGSGYISGNKFVKKINSKYYAQRPENFIKSHMPFDYLWQFSSSPISNQEFQDGKMSQYSKPKYFQFLQALANHETLSYSERLKASAQRIEENGVKNVLIKKQLEYLKTAIDHIHQNKVIDLYNSAVAHYNEALSSYNDFIDFRNKTFSQSTSDNSLKKVVNLAENEINAAKEILNSLPAANSNTTVAVNKLQKSVNNVSMDVQKQKLWLKNYLKEEKAGRKAAFYERPVFQRKTSVNY